MKGPCHCDNGYEPLTYKVKEVSCSLFSQIKSGAEPPCTQPSGKYHSDHFSSYCHPPRAFEEGGAKVLILVQHCHSRAPRHPINPSFQSWSPRVYRPGRLAQTPVPTEARSTPPWSVDTEAAPALNSSKETPVLFTSQALALEQFPGAGFQEGSDLGKEKLGQLPAQGQ